MTRKYGMQRSTSGNIWVTIRKVVTARSPRKRKRASA